MASPPLDVKLMNLTAIALMAIFAVLAMGWAARAVSRLPVFDIKAIAVHGDVNHSNAVTLRAHVASRLNGSFFSMDLARVRAAFEAVPWVRHAVVRRGFPNRLHVDLQEHVAVAYWGGESQSSLINSFGEVFEANVGEVEQDMLPRLDGPEEQSAEVLAMYRAIEPLFDSVELPVDQLELSARGSWRVKLDTGAVVELGRGNLTEVTERTRRFLKTLTQVTSRYERRVSALESADLRHENGYAIRLRGVSTVAAVASKK
jgi:cell division protein FtsQ